MRIMNNDSYEYTENDRSIMEDGEPLRQYFMSTDQNYRAENRVPVANIIEKYAKEFGVSEDAKQYILDRQVVTDWSGSHHIGDPNSDENKDRINFTNDILKITGTNDFLKEVTNEGTVRSIAGPSTGNQ